MFLKQLTGLLAAIFCLALAAAAPAQNVPSMKKDPLGHVHYLQISTDPQAVAVRTQIENGPADLAKARETAVKNDLVLDAANLQKPLPPEGQNATPLYAKLAKMLKDKPLHLPLYAQSLNGMYAYTPEQIAAVRQIYDSRPEVWALVHQVADAPQSDFARDWTKDPNLIFQEFASLREAERLLRTETYLLAAQGNYSDAVKTEARGFRVAAHTVSDPILISYLVSVACQQLALNGMGDILQLSGPNPAVAAQVKKAVETNRLGLSMRDGLGYDPARLQSREVVLLAAAAVMAAWTNKEGFPVTLPSAFSDPFTGKSLGYRREGTHGFVVYSAGPDGTFNGGKPEEKTPTTQSAFRYPVKPIPLPPNMLK